MGKKTVIVVPSPALLSITSSPPWRVDDAVDDGEAEARAARARGEERIVRAAAHLRVHALAGVLDVDRHALGAVARVAA